MTSANSIIRPATDGDAAAISAIIERIVQEPNPVGLRGPMSEDEVKGWLRRLGDQGCIFLAEVDGKAASFAALDFNTESPETGTLGVWVLPEFRRKKIGLELGEYVLDFAREKGYKRVRGRLPENNEPALSFLSELGALVPMQNPEMRF